MKLCILHLSDIHIKDGKEVILKKWESIASSCFVEARESDLTLIIATGDIAYSGKMDQYDHAVNFLSPIKDSLLSEGCKSVDIIVNPGNHDCKFNDNDIIRDSVIKSIRDDPSKAENADVMNVCTKVLDDFNSFRNAITNTKPITNDQLFCEYNFEIGDKSIRVTSLNASWMSTKNEKQGGLIFPLTSLGPQLEEKANFRIALIHHPLHWYAQTTYHPLRTLLRTKTDMILSGHEHCISSGEVDEDLVGKSLYFEAGALNPPGIKSPEWSVIKIDLDEELICQSRYELNNSLKVVKIGGIEKSLTLDNKGDDSRIALNKQFQERLKDPGGRFYHPNRGKITIDDIYVFPELEERDGVLDKNVIINSSGLFSGEGEHRRVLIMGDEKSGKTSLALMGIKLLYSLGYAPLFLKARDISSVSDRELTKHVSEVSKEQYVDYEEFARIKKQRKVVFVDDIDSIKGGGKNQYKLIEYLENHFGSLFLFADNSFEITELVDVRVSSILERYEVFEIRPFGHRLRYELIKKWCVCCGVNTRSELDQKLHAIENLVNSVIGRNIVPRKPIYLLILLQSSDSPKDGDLQNSSFAYYYQYLFTKNLSEIGVKPEQLNELFFYLTNLAWHYYQEDCQYLEGEKLRSFNQEFSSKYTSVDFQKRIEMLCKACIMQKHGNSYRFAYPYIYYFFIGKYLSNNIGDPKIAEIVESCVSNLHVKRNANFVLFLTHHSSNPSVIELVRNCLNENLAHVKPTQFNEDISSVNYLVDSVSKIIVENTDVESNQKASRSLADDIESRTKEDDEGFGEAEQEPNSLNSAIDIINQYKKLLKTAEILGQILKTYYGSLERNRKSAIISDVFNGPLRLHQSLFQEIMQDPEALIRDIEAIIEHKAKSIKADKRKKIAKNICFRMLGTLSTGLILRTSLNIASENLKEDISQVIYENDSVAYQLIGAGVDLCQPNLTNTDTIAKLARTIENNSFAFSILQSLASYHIHMFHTDVRLKQKLSEALKIDMPIARQIDFRSKKSKL